MNAEEAREMVAKLRSNADSHHESSGTERRRAADCIESLIEENLRLRAAARIVLESARNGLDECGDSEDFDMSALWIYQTLHEALAGHSDRRPDA